MATSAQILALGARRRPTQSNTIYGTFYAQRRSRLPFEQRRRLNVMEQELFCGTAPIDEIEGVLGRDERLHVTPGVGYLAFFWSADTSRYVLTEFGFEGSDAGGGLPCGVRADLPRSCAAGRSPRRALPAAARLMSSLRRKFDASAMALVARTGFLLTFGRMLVGLLDAVRSLEIARAASSKTILDAREATSAVLADEILIAHALLAKRGPLGRDDLPHWSLLKELTVASEELQNPFARSLMAGELVCRLGSATDAAWKARSKNRWVSFRSLAKFDGPLIPGGIETADWDRMHALIGIWLADDAEPGCDAVALRLLARSRLSLALARHVCRTTTESTRAGQAECRTVGNRAVLLSKVRLMSEYVALSYSNWTCEESDPNAGDALRDAGQSLFWTFDRSVEMIARQMGQARPFDDRELSLRDRISEVAFEIVSPVRSR